MKRNSYTEHITHEYSKREMYEMEIQNVSSEL